MNPRQGFGVRVGLFGVFLDLRRGETVELITSLGPSLFLSLASGSPGICLIVILHYVYFLLAPFPPLTAPLHALSHGTVSICSMCILIVGHLLAKRALLFCGHVFSVNVNGIIGSVVEFLVPRGRPGFSC